MEKERCADCGQETREENIFRHEGKAYCPECVAQHLRDKHAIGLRKTF